MGSKVVAYEKKMSRFCMQTAVKLKTTHPVVARTIEVYITIRGLQKMSFEKKENDLTGDGSVFLIFFFKIVQQSLK